MKCLAIQSSPNINGLTSTLAQAVLRGFEAGGGETELIHLNEMDVKTCIACDNGWGQCRQGDCILEDDFEALRQRVGEADALVLATPVYFGDLSESAKAFLDRLRRCEAFSDRGTCTGKKVVGTLLNLEYYLRRVGLEVFDLVPVTRFSKDHKLPMLEAAGRKLVAL